MKWLNGWSAAATFEGEFSDVTRSYAGKGVMRATRGEGLRAKRLFSFFPSAASCGEER